MITLQQTVHTTINANDNFQAKSSSHTSSSSKTLESIMYDHMTHKNTHFLFDSYGVDDHDYEQSTSRSSQFHLPHTSSSTLERLGVVFRTAARTINSATAVSIILS